MQKHAFLLGGLALTALAGCTSLLGDFDVVAPDQGDDAGASDATVDGTASDGRAPIEGGDSSKDAGDAAPSNDGGLDGNPDADAGPSCANGFKTCDGGCVSFDDPSYGCTPTSCAPCAIANAAAKCLAGSCAFDKCLSGFADCDVDAGDGCETHTDDDPAHCGTCAIACSTQGGTPNCAGGQCTSVACGSGHADCDHDAGDGCEVTTGTDTKNCGACGHVCGTAGTLSVSCNGTCAFNCNAPMAHCPASLDTAGCDVNTSNDPKNCKTCGNACATGQACVGSACTCTATSCAGGCCGNNSCTTPSVTACGSGGAACVDCTASVQNALGTKCDANTKKCGYTSCVNGYLDADGDPATGCESLSPVAVPEAANSLAGWWIADTGLTTGGGVSNWADQSGKGHTAICTSGCPSLVANGLNGHAVFSFNGGSQFFQIFGNFSTFAASGLTWFIVWNPATTGGQYEPLLSFNTTASQDSSRLEISHGGGDTNILYSVCNAGSCPGWGAGIWTTGWHAMVLNHAASGVVTYSNNQSNPGGFGFNGASSTVTLPAGQSRATSYIGLDTYSRYFNGQMAEVIVFQTSVTSASQASIEQYLKNKYGY